MDNIEFHGPPVYGEQGPFWSAYVSVPGGESEPTELLLKLTLSTDETFARKMGDRYSAVLRETIMREFAEEKIQEILSAGHLPPQELSIRVTDVDAQLMLRRWGLLE